MRYLLTLAFVLFATFAQAAEPVKKFFLEDDGSVTLRVEKIESKLAALEDRVATLEGVKLTRPIVNPSAQAPVVVKAVPAVAVKATGKCCENCQCALNQFNSALEPSTPLGVNTYTFSDGTTTVCEGGQCSTTSSRGVFGRRRR